MARVVASAVETGRNVRSPRSDEEDEEAAAEGDAKDEKDEADELDDDTMGDEGGDVVATFDEDAWPEDDDDEALAAATMTVGAGAGAYRTRLGENANGSIGSNATLVRHSDIHCDETMGMCARSPALDARVHSLSRSMHEVTEKYSRRKKNDYTSDLKRRRRRRRRSVVNDVRCAL